MDSFWHKEEDRQEEHERRTKESFCNLRWQRSVKPEKGESDRQHWYIFMPFCTLESEETEQTTHIMSLTVFAFLLFCASDVSLNPLDVVLLFLSFMLLWNDHFMTQSLLWFTQTKDLFQVVSHLHSFHAWSHECVSTQQIFNNNIQVRGSWRHLNVHLRQTVV